MTEADHTIGVEAGALFEQHGAALYRFARVLLHQQEDAEDVVQSTFMRLIQHLRRGGDRSNLRAWLFTVAANLARDRIRGRSRWVPWEAADEPRIGADLALSLADPQGEFLAAAHRLAPRDRMLLALRAQGLSYREIAEAAHIRLASVGQLLARALARWRRARETTAIM
jgi:RNA polymerase sigma-70 factor (ECF subfamily)